jgi:hypothetical protein
VLWAGALFFVVVGLFPVDHPRTPVDVILVCGAAAAIAVAWFVNDPWRPALLFGAIAALAWPVLLHSWLPSPVAIALVLATAALAAYVLVLGLIAPRMSTDAHGAKHASAQDAAPPRQPES